VSRRERVGTCGFAAEENSEFVVMTNRLIDEHKATDQEYLGQITQAEFVAKSPQHHESDNLARVLHTVQQTSATLVELRRAFQTAEPARALRRTLGGLPDGCRVASWDASHCPLRAAVVAIVAGNQRSAGATPDRTCAGG
jgi:hypothetical protein